MRANGNIETSEGSKLQSASTRFLAALVVDLSAPLKVRTCAPSSQCLRKSTRRPSASFTWRVGVPKERNASFGTGAQVSISIESLYTLKTHSSSLGAPTATAFATRQIEEPKQQPARTNLLDGHMRVTFTAGLIPTTINFLPYVCKPRQPTEPTSKPGQQTHRIRLPKATAYRAVIKGGFDSVKETLGNDVIPWMTNLIHRLLSYAATPSCCAKFRRSLRPRKHYLRRGR